MVYFSYVPTTYVVLILLYYFFPVCRSLFQSPVSWGWLLLLLFRLLFLFPGKTPRALVCWLLVTGYLNNIFIFIQAWTLLDIGSQILPRRIPIPPKAKLICGSADQRVICNFLCARVCVIVPRPWKRRPNMLALAGWRTFWGQLPGGSDTRAPIAWYLRLGSSFPSAGSILWNILVWLLQLN